MATVVAPVTAVVAHRNFSQLSTSATRRTPTNATTKSGRKKIG